MLNTEKRAIFLKFAQEIKALGYKVVVTSREDSTYGWIVNDKDEVGYFQYDAYCGIRFSTIHKPMTEFCSGFAANTDKEYYTEFTKEVVDTCFAVIPTWALSSPHIDRRYIGSIKKLTATEYFEKYWDKNNIVEL